MRHFRLFLILILTALFASTSANLPIEKRDVTQNGFDDLWSPTIDPNREFWESIFQNSILNTKRRYNVLQDDRVCFTCPIDSNTFSLLYKEAHKSQKDNPQHLPAISISWSTEVNPERLIFFCRNNTKISSIPIYLNSQVVGRNSKQDELKYSCEHNRLCLEDVKKTYPETYQCSIKAYVATVKMNVLG